MRKELMKYSLNGLHRIQWGVKLSKRISISCLLIGTQSQKHSMLSVPHQLQPDQFNNNKATGAGGFETLLVYVLLVSFFQFQSPFVKAMTTFLDASSHLCKSVCPSVRRSVGHAFVMLSWKLHEKALSAQFYHCLSMLFNAFAFSMPFGRIFGLLGLVFKWNQC